MNAPISIGTSTIPDVLLDKLQNDLQTLQRDGLLFNIDIDRVGNITFLDCRLQGQQEQYLETFKAYLANSLADIIIGEWEQRIIRKIVRQNFYYYSEEEKRIILKKAREILNPAAFSSYHIQQRKEKILLRILDYLELHQELILEGFINFRLKDYQQELEDIVNSAVDEFLLEKEYQEFIRLLKYFVDIQEPRVDDVKIVFRENGKFNLLDQENKPLQHESLEGIMLDLQEADANYEDLLISALITLAPRRVELHLEKGAAGGDTTKTIRNVFGSRVYHCPGCQLCKG